MSGGVSSLRIDLHTHILPKHWPDLRERYGYGGFLRLEHEEDGCGCLYRDDQAFRRVHSNCWDPEVRLAECDASGVDVQVLSTVPAMFSYWAKPEDTLDLARILNDHIAEVVEAHPTRFVGLGTLPMQAPDLAMAELDRCVGELGLPGVQIGTHVNGDNLNAPGCVDILAHAAEIGAAVFVHPWNMLGAERMQQYWLSWLVGMPAETALAIASVLFGGVLERLPALRICFAHGGGAFPGTIGRLQRGFEARPDLCAVDTTHPPRFYLGRFYLDSLVHDAAALTHLIALVGANRVALGSDYPFPLGEPQPGSLIQSLAGVSAEERAALFAGTALEFLGLDRRAFAT